MPSQPQIIASRRTLMHDTEGFHIQPAFITVVGSVIENVNICQEQDYEKELVKLTQALPQAKIHNFNEKCVAPAFVNAHTHLAMSFFRGLVTHAAAKGNIVEDLFFKLESHLNADDVRAFARMGAFECLLSGTGLVWDHYYFGQSVAHALQDTGLCGVVAPTLQDLHGPGMGHMRRSFIETTDIQSRKAFSDAGIFAALGPHATDSVSPQLWMEIVEVGTSQKLPIHVHVAQSKEEYERISDRHKVTPIRFLKNLGVLSADLSVLAVHCIYLTHADLELLTTAKNVTAVFCPFSQIIFHFPAALLEWERKGLNWAVATDCAASNDSMVLQKELRFVSGIAMTGVGFSEQYKSFCGAGKKRDVKKLDALRSAQMQQHAKLQDASYLLERITTHPGSRHPAFLAGVLKPGALANIAVWDTDHAALWPSRDITRGLAMCDASGALHAMMTAGRWASRPGHLQEDLLGSQAYASALNEANARLKALLTRSGLQA